MPFSWRLRHTVLAIVAAFIAVGCVAIIKYECWLRKPPALLEKPKKNDIQAQSRALLSTISRPSPERNHLLDGSFSVVRLRENITGDCRSVFESSFINDDKKKATNLTTTKLANPGQVFQSSDALIQGAPFRRLEFAGETIGRCFIYYQHGGVMYPRFCLVVIDTRSQRAIWVGEARKRAKELYQLRSMLLRGEFNDTSGFVC